MLEVDTTNNRLPKAYDCVGIDPETVLQSVPLWDAVDALVSYGAYDRLHEAYGKNAQPSIPANSTLVFVVDVLGVG